MMGLPTKRLAASGLLGALSLVFAYLEGLLPPMPMLPPGAKLGLSNVVTMYSAKELGLPCALFVAVVKAVFALLTRGVTAGLMSLAGGLISAAAAYFVFRKTDFSYIMAGVAGAFAHNFGQLLVSVALLGRAILFYVPALLLFGIVSGGLTGVLLWLINRRLKGFSLNIYKND